MELGEGTISMGDGVCLVISDLVTLRGQGPGKTTLEWAQNSGTRACTTDCAPVLFVTTILRLYAADLPPGPLIEGTHRFRVLDLGIHVTRCVWGCVSVCSPWA